MQPPEIVGMAVARRLLLPSDMRKVMILAMVLAQAGAARANSCNVGGVHLAIGDVPLGCPVVVLMESFGRFVPKVTTTRGGTVVDLTGTITMRADVQVPIEEYRYHADCELHDDGPELHPYQAVDVALVDARVGDLLAVEGSYTDGPTHVIAAGPCPDVAPPTLSCADPIQTCADAGVGGADQPAGNGAGCNAGGAASPLVLLALLGRRQDRLRDRLRRILGRVMPGRR